MRLWFAAAPGDAFALPHASSFALFGVRVGSLFLASPVARLAVVDYEALRVEARNLFASKIEEVRGSIATMQKAQRAAEQALDMSFPFSYVCRVSR